jgi:hypothetical protein
MTSELPFDVTVDDFHRQFDRGEFSYATIWSATVSYSLGDVIFIKGLNYRSLANDNEGNDPETSPGFWKQLPVSLYVLDGDIEKAFVQAGGNFNQDLFPGEPGVGKMCFLFLTAHYLLLDWFMVASPLAADNPGFITSKTVGSVSASYGVPTAILENPLYSFLAKTHFGMKYLSFLLPKLKCNVLFFPGNTNPPR